MDLSNLNEQQLEAAKKISGPVVVIAGAGSGKTRVLTHRIAYLIAQGIPSDNILAITFTNKAAEEMQTRVREIVGKSDTWISTFHSMCLRILRRHIDLIGYDKSFGIIDDDDQQSIIKKVIKDNDIAEIPFKPRVLAGMIGKMKNGYEYDLPYVVNEAVKIVYEGYIKYCKDNQLLDFEDLLLKTIDLFETSEAVLEYYQDKFQYILVDEYQDTNDVQNRLIMMLGGKHQNIFLVGDEDQSIYRFRGANYKNLLEFEKNYPNTMIVKLEQNYRSTKNILDAANSLIKHNNSKHKKNLWTDAGEGDKITYFRAVTDGDEVLYIANEIKTLLMKGVDPKEIAILYRSNFMSRKIEESLRFVDIPYIVYGGVSYFKRKEVKDLLAYLRLAINVDDNWSFTRVINEPKRGIGPVTIEKIARFAAEKGVSLFQIANNAKEYFKGNLATKLQSFADTVNEYRERIEDMDLVNFIDYVIIRTGYQSALLLQGDEGEFRLENLQEFKSIVTNYNFDLSNLEILTLILDDLSLHLDHESSVDDSVKLMTMHNAKGLEFDYVFMYGVEEGLLPNSRSMDTTEDIQEERRLAYVAITRARKKLYLTNSSIRVQYGQSNANMPSRFVNEIGIDKLDLRGTHNGKQKTNFTAPKLHKEMNLNVDAEYKLGEKLRHDAFGVGVVVSVDDKFVQIAFKSPHGIKKLLSGHPTIHKID